MSGSIDPDVCETYDRFARSRSMASAGGAVEAPARAGYRAWKNPVGGIAVLPPERYLSKIQCVKAP